MLPVDPAERGAGAWEGTGCCPWTEAPQKSKWSSVLVSVLWVTQAILIEHLWAPVEGAGCKSELPI